MTKRVQIKKFFERRGVKTISRIVEGLMKELIDDDKKESAVLMLEDGKLSKEKIAEYLRLDIEVVEALEKEQKNMVG